MVAPFDDVSRFSIPGGDPFDFDNDKALDCVAIGFGENEFKEIGLTGFIINVTVKYGPRACAKTYVSSGIARNSLEGRGGCFEKNLMQCMCRNEIRHKIHKYILRAHLQVYIIHYSIFY